MKLLIAIFLSMIIFISCIKEIQVQSEKKYHIQGFVLDKYSNKPFFKSIKLYVTDMFPSTTYAESQTDSNGYFSFNFSNDPTKLIFYTLRVKDPDYKIHFEDDEKAKNINSVNFTHNFYGTCTCNDYITLYTDSSSLYDSIIVKVVNPEFTVNVKMTSYNYNEFYFQTVIFATNPNYFTFKKFKNGSYLELFETIYKDCSQDDYFDTLITN